MCAHKLGESEPADILPLKSILARLSAGLPVRVARGSVSRRKFLIAKPFRATRCSSPAASATCEFLTPDPHRFAGTTLRSFLQRRAPIQCALKGGTVNRPRTHVSRRKEKAGGTRGRNVASHINASKYQVEVPREIFCSAAIRRRETPRFARRRRPRNREFPPQYARGGRHTATRRHCARRV